MIKIKTQKGVSLITLVVTIIVIVILASITTISGLDSIGEANDTKIDAEISALKEAAARRLIDFERSPGKYPLAGKKIDDITEYLYCIERMSNDEIMDAVKAINDENIAYYRLVDAAAAKQIGVDSVGDKHYYIINYMDGTVYGNINMDLIGSGESY